MFNDEVRKVLDKPLIARMSTIDANGYPHTIPVWFGIDGDDIVIISERKTLKVNHIARSGKGAVQIGGDPELADGDGTGYLFKGTFSVEEDPDYKWLKALTNRYEEPEEAAKDIALWTTWDMIVIRFKPERTIKVL